jgi:transposase-like protein
MDAAPDVRALARELGVGRALLYRWQRLYLRGGSAAVRNSGRPRPVLMLTPDAGRPTGEPAAACRIAELERKIGQQQLELDFFAQPCGMSGDRAGRTACLVGR